MPASESFLTDPAETETPASAGFRHAAAVRCAVACRVWKIAVQVGAFKRPAHAASSLHFSEKDISIDIP